MTLSFTILQQGPGYTFIWELQPKRVERFDTAVHCLTNIILHPQQQAELQAALDSAAQLANQLSLRSPEGTASGQPTTQLLKRLGSVMFSQLLPEALQEWIRRLPPSTPLLIRSNDKSLPWELLHDDQNFLALRHSMGRLMLSEATSRIQAQIKHKQLSCLLIGNPTSDLSSADEEIEALLDVMDMSPRRPRIEFLSRACIQGTGTHSAC
ncbi:MAG: hypothetical protein R3E79_42255 [Caldilineaceae bacterium]